MITQVRNFRVMTQDDSLLIIFVSVLTYDISILGVISNFSSDMMSHPMNHKLMLSIYNKINFYAQLLFDDWAFSN